MPEIPVVYSSQQQTLRDSPKKGFELMKKEPSEAPAPAPAAPPRPRAPAPPAPAQEKVTHSRLFTFRRETSSMMQSPRALRKRRSPVRPACCKPASDLL